MGTRGDADAKANKLETVTDVIEAILTLKKYTWAERRQRSHTSNRSH